MGWGVREGCVCVRVHVWWWWWWGAWMRASAGIDTTAAMRALLCPLECGEAGCNYWCQAAQQRAPTATQLVDAISPDNPSNPGFGCTLCPGLSSLPAPKPPTPTPSQAWAAPGTGLVVSERLINCPPQLAPPLAQNLFEEIAAEAEDGESQVGTWCTTLRCAALRFMACAACRSVELVGSRRWDEGGPLDSGLLCSARKLRQAVR